MTRVTHGAWFLTVGCLGLALVGGCGLDDVIVPPEPAEKLKNHNILEGVEESEIEKYRELIAAEEARLEETYTSEAYQAMIAEQVGPNQGVGHPDEEQDWEQSSVSYEPDSEDSLALPEDESTEQ
ncbi:hypothetical protein [Rhodopirellula sallentina]|uniref:hypothetical protein n=1 Tax=Rhodopirellula sallentina TaxID=1263869 RepID=UPI001181B8A4|nr:hypothetical protein [Rhodopirellula sallentina]